MARLIAGVVLGLVVLPGCLYAVAAKAALSAIAGVASVVASGSPAEEAAIPQDKAAILEAYKNCVQQRSSNPQADCSRYRRAWEATAK
jgi:hypothetical protein